MPRSTDPETLTLRSPEELGVRLYPRPPRGFDPVRASHSELLEYGYPRRPDADSQPAAYAIWRRATSPSITRVEPVFGVYPGWPGEPGGLIGSGGGAGSPTATLPNWAGSVAHADDRYPFDTVTGQWTVPYVYPVPGSSADVFLCDSWVGFDAATPDPNPQQLIQAGTTTQYDGDDGARQTFAWWEWQPNDSVVITYPAVDIGDVIFCTVSANSRDENGWIDDASFVLLNINSGQMISFAKSRPTFPTYTIPSPGFTAEWIVENPTPQPDSKVTATVGQFGAVYFTGWASTGVEPDWTTNAGEGEMITMVYPPGVAWVSPQSLGPTAFIVSHVGNPGPTE
jgi:Peptidase A4 family